MKKSKEKKQEKADRHFYIRSATARIGTALFSTIPGSDEISVNVYTKGYRRSLIIRRDDEVLVLRIRRNGDVELLFMHGEDDNFSNYIGCFEEFVEDRENYINELGEKVFVIFEAFFSGNLLTIIKESLSENKEGDKEHTGSEDPSHEGTDQRNASDK